MNINDYKNIVIYRHINPDYDAFGSQLGMYFLLKDNFDLNIVIAGDTNHDLMNCYPDFTSDQLKEGKTLGIVVDTANKERIEGDISICDAIVKIDHHIIVDQYGDENYVDESASSCSEVITLLANKRNIKISKNAATCLYVGIVGDSGRFLFNSTSENTFKAASILIKEGIDLASIYQSMYLCDESSLQVNKFIYNNYINDGGVAYYILKDEDLKMLGISRSEGSNYVNLLSNIKQIHIWMAITENKEDGNFRVSIRSREKAINEVANHFNGGGHTLASGATLDSLDDLNQLLQELKELL